MYNINNIYNNYIEEYNETVDKNTFKKICEEFNIEIIDAILDGKTFDMGNNLSTLSIRRVDRDPRTPRVDWGESIKYRKELEARQERLSKESKNRWRDNSEYRKLIVKANSKAVIIEGIKYQSITKATKIYGLANNTISARCRNPKFPNFNFVNINENNKTGA